jgi:hypothetical protein
MSEFMGECDLKVSPTVRQSRRVKILDFYLTIHDSDIAACLKRGRRGTIKV